MANETITRAATGSHRFFSHHAATSIHVLGSHVLYLAALTAFATSASFAEMLGEESHGAEWCHAGVRTEGLRGRTCNRSRCLEAEPAFLVTGIDRSSAQHVASMWWVWPHASLGNCLYAFPQVSDGKVEHDDLDRGRWHWPRQSSLTDGFEEYKYQLWFGQILSLIIPTSFLPFSHPHILHSVDRTNQFLFSHPHHEARNLPNRPVRRHQLSTCSTRTGESSSWVYWW